ncbi:MAG: FAD-dependent oxidoreductase [Ruminococcaceae bacterium]|nr:FAD-dependent oxidoreductase [Oscillospiraceae bacterium]
MDSVWVQNIKVSQFPPLEKNIKTKVLIVGSGMAGILCAYMLKNSGMDCVLVEAKEICSGVTQNTTAKISLQHGLIYNKLINDLGKEKAYLYLKAQKDACDEYARICKNIDCDFKTVDSYVYSLDDELKIKREVEALSSLGVKAELLRNVDLPIKIAGAVRVRNQAQFHPLKFAYSISKELPIYENTKVLQLMPNKAITTRGEITFEKIIIATHFPIINKHGGYFLKMYQHRSYVIALEGADKINGIYVDENKKGMSFRSYGDLLLLGGGAHRTGKQGGNWRVLEEFANKAYPSAKIVGKWATQDCMTLDGIPYIGLYSQNTPNTYVITGFNKWGMTSSMVGAMLLTDLILERKNSCTNIFSPSRSILKPQLAMNIFESLIGIITPTVPRCPHLGCALKYNRDERSWDCPCHGSRFGMNGELLNNPATDDKK